MRRTVEQIIADIATQHTPSTLDNLVERLTGIDPVSLTAFSYHEGGYFIFIGTKTMIDVRDEHGAVTLDARQDQIVPHVARWIAENT